MSNDETLPEPIVEWQPTHRPPLFNRALARVEGASATASSALGAFALGAMAMGALAIGALAIGRLRVGRAKLGVVEIDHLIVHRKTGI